MFFLATVVATEEALLAVSSWSRIMAIAKNQTVSVLGRKSMKIGARCHPRVEYHAIWRVFPLQKLRHRVLKILEVCELWEPQIVRLHKSACGF